MQPDAKESPADRVVANLRQLRLVKVEIKLSSFLEINDKDALKEEIITTQLIRQHSWPRLTFNIGGKEKKISIVEYHKNRMRKDAFDFDPLELVVWKLVAGNMPTKKVAFKGRLAEFVRVTSEIKKKIRHSTYRASKTKKSREVMKGRMHKENRAEAMHCVRAAFKDAVRVLQERDIRRIWKEEKDLVIVTDVLDT